jgi:starch-binding outer membrane protein, SusD/RagB family
MKLTINKMILAGGLLCAIFSSCKKDFLDPHPTDRLAESSVWTSPSLIEASVNALYKDLANGIFSRYGFGWDQQMMAGVTDECASVYEGYERRDLLVNGQMNPDNITEPFMSRLGWREQWGYVSLANEFLSRMETVTILSESEKSRLIGEAKLMRAFHYFNLLKQFGGLPLIDKPFKLGDDYFNVTRSGIEETLTFILADINDAIALLPETAAIKGKVDKNVAHALKSRVTLFAASPLYTNGVNDQAKWQAAADAAKVLIDGGKYSLIMDMEKYRKMFVTYDPASSEIIFAREYTTLIGPEYGSNLLNPAYSHGTTGAGGVAYHTPIQQMVESYEMSNGKMINEAGSGYDDQHPYVNRDPRFYAFVYYHGAKLNNRALDFRENGFDMQVGIYANPTGYCMRKFINEARYNADATEIIDVMTNDPVPWIYFRYAEILLNYAEAINEASGPALAYDAINEIRHRAGMPDLPMGLSQDEMRERVRHERRIELAFEEHRYFDVRRWKIAQQTENITVDMIKITGDIGSEVYETVPTHGPEVTVERHFLPHQYFWPIMRSEILINPRLEQNPGY